VTNYSFAVNPGRKAIASQEETISIEDTTIYRVVLSKTGAAAGNCGSAMKPRLATAPARLASQLKHYPRAYHRNGFGNLMGYHGDARQRVIVHFVFPWGKELI
jgi:hypothetical protein